MYGISGKRIATDGVDEALAAGADTWVEAQEQAQRARELGWQKVRVVPAAAHTCHSPLGYSPTTPVCALGRDHAGDWHQTSDGLLTWRDDDPAALSAALENQRERDSRSVADAMREE